MHRLNRKQCLNPLAIEFGLNPHMYKNKNLLISAIQKKMDLKRSERCYNNCDPCTLEHIDEIEDNDYIEWYQIGVRFGANKSSIISMINNNIQTLPWAVDFYTKSYISSNLDTLNMKNVPVIKDIMTNNNQNHVPEENVISFTNWFLCEISKLVGTNSYCEGKVIEELINEDYVSRIYEKLYNGMVRLLNRLDDDDNFIQELFYQCVFTAYIRNGIFILDKESHLRYVMYLFNNFKSILATENYILFDTFFNDI